jgi:hypothetical protein
MKRRVVVAVVLALLLCSAVGSFAFEQKSTAYPWMASFNKTGQLNLYAAIGLYYYGFDLDAGPEFILGNFNISGVPLEWGLMARGLLGFASFGGTSWVDYGVAPMVTLHWGTDFGGPLKFDWYVGLGLGISGSTVNYGYYSYGSGIGLGFSSADGVAWQILENLSVILDYAYSGYFSVWGVGVRLNL